MFASKLEDIGETSLEMARISDWKRGKESWCGFANKAMLSIALLLRSLLTINDAQDTPA